MSPFFLLLYCLIFFLAAFTQGVTGFGSALVVVPLLSLFMNIRTVVPLSILQGLVVTLFLTYRMRRHLDGKRLLPLVIGCLPGVATGCLLLKWMPELFLKVLLGIILLLYGGFNFSRKEVRTCRLSNRWGYLAGYGTGLLGAALSTGGPPAVIYTALSGWSKDEIKATLSIFFLFTGTTVALAQFAGNLMPQETGYLFLVGLPAVVAGVLSGAKCYDFLPHRLYLRAVHLLLVAMGVLLLGSSVVGMVH